VLRHGLWITDPGCCCVQSTYTPLLLQSILLYRHSSNLPSEAERFCCCREYLDIHPSPQLLVVICSSLGPPQQPMDPHCFTVSGLFSRKSLPLSLLNPSLFRGQFHHHLQTFHMGHAIVTARAVR